MIGFSWGRKVFPGCAGPVTISASLPPFPFSCIFKTQLPPAGNSPSVECPQPLYSSSTPVEICCLMLCRSVLSETFPSSPWASSASIPEVLSGVPVSMGRHHEPGGRCRGFPGQVTVGKDQSVCCLSTPGFRGVGWMPRLLFGAGVSLPSRLGDAWALQLGEEAGSLSLRFAAALLTIAMGQPEEPAVCASALLSAP